MKTSILVYGDNDTYANKDLHNAKFSDMIVNTLILVEFLAKVRYIFQY